MSLTVNFGLRHKLNEHAHLDRVIRPRAAFAIATIEPLAFIGYCGVQLLY